MLSKYIVDNTFFIVPSKLKEELLFLINKKDHLINVSFTTLEECKVKLFHEYDERAIFHLTRKHNLKPANAKIILENLKYCDLGDLEVLKELNSIKNELIDLGYLFKDEHYFKRFKNKKVIIIGYYLEDYLTREVLSRIDNYEIVRNDTRDLNNKEIYEFETLSDEVEFVATKIASLIHSGVSPDKIKLVNVNKEYELEIERIFRAFNIGFKLDNKISLNNLPVIREFIDLIRVNSYQDALILLKEKYDLVKTNPRIYNKIVEVGNKYNWYQGEFSEIIDLIEYTFSNTSLSESKVNIVTTSSLNIENVLDNYVFLLSFNHGVCPYIHKDDEYLSDEVKKRLGLDTSSKLNKLEKEMMKNLLGCVENLTISYKLESNEGVHLPSLLVEELGLKVSKDYKIDPLISYSKKYDLYKLGSKLDDFINYSIKDDTLSLFYSNYRNSSYRSYDNSFTGLNKETRDEYMEKIDRLSFSSLDDLFNCSFTFYLKHILKLEDRETNFNMFIGQLFHYVLSKVYDKDFDFETEFNYFVNNSEIKLTSKDEVLLIRLKDELRSIIEIILEQYAQTSFKKVELEKSISIDIKNYSSIYLTGVIDKIMMLEEDDKRYAVVVDYKTGSSSISHDFSYVEHGINLQLLIYLYLLRKSKEYADIFIVGFYYQLIAAKDPKLSFKDDPESKKYNVTKLDGYTLNNAELIKKLDNSYASNPFIRGISTLKSGEIKNTREISEETIKEYIDIVEKNIESALRIIENGDFKINPKVYKNGDSCKHCPFKDICFVRYENKVNLDKLGGDNSEME